jgi:Helix-hairpin-helix motif
MHRAAHKGRTTPHRSRTVWWLLAVLISGVGGYLLHSPAGSPAFTPLPGGRVVTPSPIQDRGVVPPVSAPPRGGAAPRTPQMRTFSVVDLNSAALAQLQTLPGITPDYARKIIAGRPYQSLQDVERAGIPREVVDQISPPAIIRSVQAPPSTKGRTDR